MHEVEQGDLCVQLAALGSRSFGGRYRRFCATLREDADAVCLGKAGQGTDNHQQTIWRLAVGCSSNVLKLRRRGEAGMGGRPVVF
jgi:hypothetical protein